MKKVCMWVRNLDRKLIIDFFEKTAMYLNLCLLKVPNMGCKILKHKSKKNGKMKSTLIDQLFYKW